jgi:anti-anti-sigma factor
VEEALLLSEQNNVIYIRAVGHITANSCADLKARVFERIEAEPIIGNLYVDLSSCNYMDSTFMGLLVGFNKRFLRVAERPITILGATDTCAKLLKTIGIARMVVMSDEMVAYPERMEAVGGAKADASFLLAAHEDLIELSEENEKRFSALRTVLAKELEKRPEDQDR